jgi:single-stranded-DNA-specific exonuclease
VTDPGTAGSPSLFPHLIILGGMAADVRQTTSRFSPGNPAPTRVWIEPAPIPPGTARLHDDPLLHEILARRLGDAAAAADFLDARERPVPDPHRLPGMTEAVERVAAALRADEQIGVFGDYDTDGVTSAAILTLGFGAASGGRQPVAVRLPRRPEGYGLSVAGVDDLADAGARLLIAVDCGSKDHEAVARARRRGLDVVIFDHHRLTEPPPEGAVLASAQLVPNAPYRELSAAGLAYLLVAALAQAGFDAGHGPGVEPRSLLDLAMIGLIGDVSSLLGVNRSLVRDGLRAIRKGPRPGLRALCESAGIDPARLSSADVAFMISPRLNAPGRLGDPRPAFDLLVSRDEASATRLALAAEQANRQRRAMQDRIIAEIDAAVASDPAHLARRVLVVAGDSWEPGVVGLAAGKLAERYDRPVIVLATDGAEARGSARSVPGIDITTALGQAADLLTRHGGHERAAGLTLPHAKIGELAAALEDAIERAGAPLPGPARLRIDADLPDDRVRLDVAGAIETLGPFGEGNPVPSLRVEGMPIRGYTVMGRERQHLKLQTIGRSGMVDAILWNGAPRSRELIGARRVDLVGQLEANIWNGSTRVQIKLADFRVS